MAPPRSSPAALPASIVLQETGRSSLSTSDADETASLCSLHSSFSSVSSDITSFSSDDFLLPESNISRNLDQQVYQFLLPATNHAATSRLSSQRPTSRRKSPALLLGLTCLVVLATYMAVSSIPTHIHPPDLLHPIGALHEAPLEDDQSVRFLSLGSASTLGVGLDDPEGQAFPYLLSPTAHTAASNSGSSLPALCAQSIVGDSAIYDVLVLEYTDDDSAQVVHLAQRLRQRFPNAVLVLVRLWFPAQDIVYDERLSAAQWWKQQQQEQQQHQHDDSSDDTDVDPSLRTDEFRNAVIVSNHAQWSFRRPRLAAAETAGALLVDLPYPTPDESATSVLTNSHYMNLYHDTDPSVLSKLGHQVIARGIHKVLHDHHYSPQELLQLPNRHVVGSWGAGDACNLWYANGDTTLLRSRRRASVVEFSRGSTAHKHAVEISRRGGSLQVTNPFDEPRMLYLTYMTAAKNNQDVPEYPRTKIGINGRPTVLIDPIHDDSQQDHHLTRTTAVGMVPPGTIPVQLDSVGTSQHRFRLVGMHVLDKGKVPIPFEYAMEPEPAPDRS